MSKRAFTLIELLIVVAIIAILAAIAVPNFLEAQTRAKVSRVKNDLRTLDTCLNSYVIDYNSFPACHTFGVAVNPFPTDGGIASPQGYVLERLSTPIAYCTTSTTRDPFTISSRYSDNTALGIALGGSDPVSPSTDVVAQINSYIYQAVGEAGRIQTTSDGFGDPWDGKASQFFLHSAGPDGAYHNLGGVLANDDEIDGPILLIYDPTNGTVSFGSIYRVGGSPLGGGSYAAGSGLRRAINASSN